MNHELKDADGDHIPADHENDRQRRHRESRETQAARSRLQSLGYTEREIADKLGLPFSR